MPYENAFPRGTGRQHSVKSYFQAVDEKSPIVQFAKDPRKDFAKFGSVACSQVLAQTPEHSRFTLHKVSYFRDTTGSPQIDD